MKEQTIDAEVVKTNPEMAVAVRPSQEVAPPGLFGTHEPVAIIEKATNVATALKAVISKQGLISKISGKEYPKCEAWTLLGTMLGVFPVLCWSRQVEGGWEARVEARTRDGATVGAAEAQCLRAERNWSNRDDFALRSMAQTRATAKCLRMPLGFVMTLAGYEPTPAEEMVSDHPQRPPASAGSAPKAAGAPAAPAPSPRPAQPRNAPQPPKAAPAAATVVDRAKMIAHLKAQEGEPNRRLAHNFFETISWLMPNETLEEMELRFVANTPEKLKAAADMMGHFEQGDQVQEPYEPAEIPEAPRPARPQPARRSEPKPLEDPAPGQEMPPDLPFLRGKIEQVNVSHGNSRRGPWTLFGIRIGEVWVNTFSHTIGEAADANEGKQVALYYSEDAKGKKAVELVLADGTRIKSEDK